MHSSARPTSPTKSSYGSTENIKSSYGFPVSELPGRDEKTRATVLVVEDDESHRIALNTLLERENYSVMTLADGREILSVIDKIKPDVILLDVMLPYLSGIEICQLIRENNSKIPIIILDNLDKPLFHAGRIIRYHRIHNQPAYTRNGVKKIHIHPLAQIA